MPSDKTILLVDDDPDALEVFTLAFEHFGYHVLNATSGTEGVSLASSARPDLILMDLGLPGMDGWEATHVLKTSPETAAIPVIAVTVHVHDFHRGRAQAVGCDSFICKPCSPKKLKLEVERLLSRT